MMEEVMMLQVIVGHTIHGGPVVLWTQGGLVCCGHRVV